MKGVYRHCSEKHPHRYLTEFDFGTATAFGLSLTLAIRQTARCSGASTV
jgi:hypothetical protein